MPILRGFLFAFLGLISTERNRVADCKSVSPLNLLRKRSTPVSGILVCRQVYMWLTLRALIGDTKCSGVVRSGACILRRLDSSSQ